MDDGVFFGGENLTDPSFTVRIGRTRMCYSANEDVSYSIKKDTE